MFKNLKYYWILTRPVNLGIIALTQLIFILHGSEYAWHNIRYPELIWMVLSVILTAAAGYVINDIFDIEEDQINVPELRIVSRHISLRNSKIFYIILAACSLTCGFISSYSMGFLCLAIGTMLYFYSSDLKGTSIWGNLLVSFISGAVVFTSARAVITVYDGYFAEYALLAFLISMPREIIKDIEDMEGDKLHENETFPIKYGIRKSIFLSIAFILLMMACVLYLMIRHGNLVYNIYCTLFILIPSIIIAIYTLKATEKKQFSKLSLVLKISMLTGMCSVLFL